MMPARLNLVGRVFGRLTVSGAAGVSVHGKTLLDCECGSASATSAIPRERREEGETEMGREVRRVPKDWVHPMDHYGIPIPLHDGSQDEAAAKWLDGLASFKQDDIARYYWEYSGDPPKGPDERGGYMFVEKRDDLTHFMLYETTSEGTPCRGCPVFATLEELCEWAAVHATTFASFTATKEEWRTMLGAGFVHATDPSMPGVIFT